MKCRAIVVTLFLMLLLMAFSPGNPAQAQTETGQIAGTITDPNGAVVPNAPVTLRSLDKQFVRNATTSSTGAYTFTNLQPGIYEIGVQVSGFAPFTRRVQVTVGSRNAVNAQLALSGSNTTVEVTAETGAQVDTTTQTLSQVVTQEQITQLPTITRNPYDLVGIAGNVTTSEAQNFRGVGFSINGQRAASTNILLDGGENRDEFTTLVGTNVPLDSVQEFRVLTNNFLAEYGRATGGIVNVATRSGTNTLHGSVYEFNRNSAFAANSFENNARGLPQGTFNRNQFGYAIGGPIMRNKLFFFNSTEWLRVRSSQLETALVPAPQFIAAAAPGTQAVFNQFGTLNPNAVMGPTLTINSLTGGGTISPANFGPLLSALPANTPIFQTVSYPVPTNAGGGFPQNGYNGVLRIDLNATDKTTLFGRYAGDHNVQEPGTISTSPYQGFFTGQKYLNQNFLLNLTHVFSPNVVSQSKAEYSRLNLLQPLGTQPIGPTLYLQESTVATIGGVNVGMPGYLPFSPGNAIPFGGPQNLYQFYQDISVTHGSHQLRFGAQYVHTRDNRTFGAFETPVANLAAQGDVETGLENFLAGQLFSFQAAIDPQGKFPCVTDPNTGDPIVTPECTITTPVGPPRFSRNNRYNDWAAYVQDSWKVRPRFTVNLGVRWEYFGVQHNADPNLDSNFYYGPGATRFEQIASGQVLTVPNSPDKALWKPDYNNFAPRVGFAWDLFGDGSTSFRGGYGMGYERNFGNVTFNVIQNPPNYAVVSLVSGVDVPSIPLSASNAGPLAGAGATVPLPRTSLRHIDQNIATAYAHFYSLALEHQFARNTVLALEYSGSRGLHQYTIENLNRPGFGTIYLGVPATDANPFPRFNQQYTNINSRGSHGDSYYNGLNVRLQSSNFANHGLTLVGNYTWSHAIDTLSSTFSESSNNFNLGLLDPFNAAVDRGNADYDMRHRVSISAVYEPPLFRSTKGFLGQVIGGWSFNPIFTANTGTPFTVFDCTNAIQVCSRYIPATGSVDITGGSHKPPPVPGENGNEPNLFTYQVLPPALPYADPVFGASDFPVCGASGPGFLTLPPGTLANNCQFPLAMTRRNAFRGPGHWNLDFGLYKTFKITERVGLQLRGEAFNIFNHANLFVVGSSADVSSTLLPAGAPGCAAGGCPYIQAKRGGLFNPALPDIDVRERRNLQIGAKITF